MSIISIVIFSDWDRPDNDRITIKINNQIVADNMLITATPQSFQINNLHQGNNKLEIIPTALGITE